MLTTVYNILVSNAEYNELGAEYVKSKLRRRKKYLTAELSKLDTKFRLPRNRQDRRQKNVPIT